MNAFNTAHLLAIEDALKGTEAVVKCSAVFTEAVVIGRLNKPGCLVISQFEYEEDQDGKYPFLTSYFKEHDPKSVSDNKVDFSESHTDSFYNWNDLINFIVSMAKGDFSEKTYLSL